MVRLLLANSSALTNLVWAEDGLFPLCVRAAGVVPCTLDPFAGYFLLVPRLVAWPVSLFPLEEWPLVTNLAAALLAAAAAALSVVVLRSAGLTVAGSALVSLLPTLTPIMGFEAINATGSSYMLLVFVSALALSFPPQGRFPTVPFAAGALVVALTIPSSVILLLPLAVQTLRRRIPLRGAVLTAGAMTAGLAVQAVVAATATNPRQLVWSLEALRSWADVLPSALLTFWPGTTALTVEGTFTSAVAAGWGEVGVAAALAVTVCGVVLVVRRGALANGVGLLLLVGVLMGAFPAVIGYANNRYYVIPTLLWVAAALIALDRSIRWRPEAVMAVVGIALAATWAPSLPASYLRSTAVPEWPVMLGAARAACAADPAGSLPITFTPAWPFADAVFTGPTTSVVRCVDIR